MKWNLKIIIWFYSHVIYLGTKIGRAVVFDFGLFYSHVIYLGTKIIDLLDC